MKLKAEIRTISGKKVKTRRRTGIIPAVLYGHLKATVSLALSLKEFQKIYQQAGESELIDLIIGDNPAVKVLVKATQRDPITDLLIHTDLYQVNLSEKVTATVPIKITGESPTVKSGQAMLLTPLPAIEIEALPLDLPAEITVDISGLITIGDHLTVKDLIVNREKVTLKHSPESIVAKLDYPEMKEEEVKEEVTPEEVEITKEKKDEAGEESTAEPEAKGKKETPAKEAGKTKEK